jgi:phosphoribosylglycinamide formyltransferase-1
MLKSGNDLLHRKLVILASGRGSNARAIIDYFKSSDKVKTALVVSNKKDAGVLEMAEECGIETMVIDRELFYNTEILDRTLLQIDPDLIILAGFLWLVPERLLQKFPRKMLNIHPALLPKYGGKGMFGIHVHRAVKASGDEESGITIHFIDEEYDKGEAVFQARTKLDPNDSPEEIASRVLKLEHHHFPRVIERILFD